VRATGDTTLQTHKRTAKNRLSQAGGGGGGMAPVVGAWLCSESSSLQLS
jgi:hypothetical protein